MAAEVRDVVECFLRNGLCHGFSLRSVPSKNDDARVVVLHGQAPVVLGLFDFPDVLAGKDTTAG